MGIKGIGHEAKLDEEMISSSRRKYDLRSRSTLQRPPSLLRMIPGRGHRSLKRLGCFGK